jgi:hypothetical protein
VPPKIQPGYDLRRGATAYSPIIGTLGALAVPGIIVQFTPSKSLITAHATLITFAAGLLIVGVIASFISAIALAAIGAEREPTANLAPAVMIVAMPAVMSFVAILAL